MIVCKQQESSYEHASAPLFVCPLAPWSLIDESIITAVL
jgi:hypothetical protein